MTVKEIYLKIRGSEAYRKWEKDNSNYYLVHFLFMDDDSGKETWNVGYYNDTSKSMASFEPEGDDVKVVEEKELFQRKEEAIRPLIIDDVKKDLEEIKEASENFRKENYRNELPLKSMFLLQNLKKFGQVWNITIFTRTFKTLNIKIDSSTGEVKNHELSKLFDFDDGKK